MSQTSRALCALWLTAFAAPALHAQSFQGIGFLSSPTPSSTAKDVSSDGSVVVGESSSPTGVGTTLGGAYRWDGALQALPYLYPDFPYGTLARGVSSNGAVAVGGSAGRTFAGLAATRWVGSTAQFVGPPFTASAYAASADGSVVVGQVAAQTFRWANGSAQVIVIGGQSIGRDVSANGAVMVGYAFTPSTRAYRWENGAVTFLPDLAEDSDEYVTDAYGISADARIIVGYAGSAAGQRMVRWVDGVVENLGPGLAYSTSADGEVVVGASSVTANGRRALIWRPGAGVQDLRAFLVDSLGLNLTGWTLLQANAVSDDGTTIVGDGRDPAGRLQGWRARLRTTLTVNVTGDTPDTNPADGVCDAVAATPGNQCTLRAAFQEAEAQSGMQPIRFRLPEDDFTIIVGSNLPILTQPTDIVAAPRMDGRLGVRIDGAGRMGDGIVIASGGPVHIEGLSVTGFRGAGIALGGAGRHVVERCHLGVGVVGNEPGANGAGVLVAAPGATVRASVVSGNRWPDGTAGAGRVLDAYVGTGVLVVTADAAGVTVARNLLGVTADSLAARPNTVGVAAVGVAGLVVEGNTVLAERAGVRLTGSESAPTTDARIVGNTLGLLPTGQIPPTGPSSGVGVLVENARGTRVGGAAARTGRAPGNVIGGWGVAVFAIGTAAGRATGTRIAGNLVGLDSTGTAARPNGVGVGVSGGAADTRVGGWAAGERNVISGSIATAGSGGAGIAVTSGDGTATTGEPTATVIAGNTIGTDIAGTTRIGNGRWGIYVGPYPGGAAGGVSDVTIGATAAMAGGAPPERRRNVVLGSREANVFVDRTGPASDAPVRVVGNWIGLDATGAGGIDQGTYGGATRVGVHVRGTARAVVGGAGEDGNVVSGHRVGVWMAADDGVVVGNRVGTDPAGLARRANSHGVAVSGSRVRVGLAADGTAVPNVVSGNILAGASNGINDGVGIFVASADFVEGVAGRGAARGEAGGLAFLRADTPEQAAARVDEPLARGSAPPAVDNVVGYNLVGLTATGDAAVVPTPEVNRTIAVWVSSGAVGTQVYANAISGTYAGLVVLAPTNVTVTTFPAGTRVAGNRIGLAAAGGDDAFVPNRRFGLYVAGDTDTVVGDGAVAGQGPNRIAGTGTQGSGLPPPDSAPGIVILHPDDAPNGWPVGGPTLRRNLVYGNEGLAVTRDAEHFGVTPNSGDNTSGGLSFNHPDLFRAVADGAALTVTGQVQVPMAVEVYADRPCDASGHGEGRVYLGTVQSADGGFDGTVAAPPAPDWRVSVTGTNAGGVTSEFSRCQPVSAPGEALARAVGSGETPTVAGPDLTLAVTSNSGRPEGRAEGLARGAETSGSETSGAAASVAEASGAAARAAGTLYVGLHRGPADDGPAGGAFAGAATGSDGTTVAPNAVLRQRFWSVRTDGLAGIVYTACLRTDGLAGLPMPGQAVVVTRPSRGAAWTPHPSTRTLAGAAAFLCAAGLTGVGDLAVGVDGRVNPVAAEAEPDAGPQEAPPTAFSLATHPNPARGAATVTVAMPTAGPVRVEAFDALGRRVALLHDGPLAAGTHTLGLDAAALPPGVYVVRAVTGATVASRRLTVVR